MRAPDTKARKRLNPPPPSPNMLANIIRRIRGSARFGWCSGSASCGWAGRIRWCRSAISLFRIGTEATSPGVVEFSELIDGKPSLLWIEGNPFRRIEGVN